MATIAILTPSRGEPHPHYVGALEYNVELPHVVLSAFGKPVDVARNELAARVRAMRDRPKYVAWVDDDAYWMRGTLSRLIANLEATNKPYRAVVGGFHGGRNPSDQIHAYVRKGSDYVTISYPSRRIGVHEKPLAVPCDVIGSHMLVHRTELLDRLDVAPFTVPEGSDYGEDFAFAERVRIAPELYAAGIADLERLARDGKRVAIMCSEGAYKDCHRHTMIAPDLERDGFRVIHIARPRYTAPRIRPDPELPCV